MSRKIDLTGKRFGKLTVISEATPAANGSLRWVCRCDCGNTVEVLGSNLKRLHTKSCGCDKSPDITGQVFGKLTVVGRSNQRGQRGERTVPLWECRCECGAITYKAKDTLTNPDMSMCFECAQKYAAAKANAGAGFVDGTQLAKIRDMTPSAANTSGYRGVYYDKKSERYSAQIIFKGKRYHLGTYKNKEDAIKARRRAEQDFYGAFLESFDSAKDGAPNEREDPKK